MTRGATIAVGIGAAVVALFVGAAALQQYEQRQRSEQLGAIFSDLIEAKTIGGTLEEIEIGPVTVGEIPGAEPRAQFVCLDQADALRPSLAEAGDAASQIETALTNDGRCTWTDAKDRFTMTADGAEHFVTPDGPLDVWAPPARETP
jgi:hypothetical protein